MASADLLPWNSAPGRSIDIELGGQEVINIELDTLDSNADDVLEVLKEGQPKVAYWTRLAGEYMRRGHLDAAEKIALSAIDSFQSSGSTSSLPPIYSILASIQLAKARKAPKLKLHNARQDIMTAEKSRDEYMREATQLLNHGDQAAAEGGEISSATKELLLLTRAIHQLANRSMEDALRSFEAVLKERPTNLIALLGKARILYARRQYAPALKRFQQALQLNPYCLPDPRIGIGLCLWALNHREKAKAAWERSVEVNPSEWSGQLLLGLDALNASKNPDLSEDDRIQELMVGSKLIEKAFNSNQRNASAANALCDIFLRKGQYKRALKLAERTIQFADTMAVLTDGYIRAGRVCHAEGSYSDALKHYKQGADGQSKNVLAAIGFAQMQLQNDETAAAIHTLDSLLQPPNLPRSLEATAMLASLRLHPRPGVSSSDAAQERTKARELFDRVYRAIEQYDDGAVQNGNASRSEPPPRVVVDDVEMHIEFSRLLQSENLDRAGKIFREAVRISEDGRVDPRLLNNLGVVSHLQSRFEEARVMYENALVGARVLGAEAEATSTSVLYNLARVYEDLNDDAKAMEAYEKLLDRHPEYVDAKIRRAHILSNMHQASEAHDLLKDSLASQSSNLNLRAYYTYFLIQSNASRPAREFVFGTLRDHDKHDLYALCAAGWLHYHQARESRDTSAKGVEERRVFFRRSAEFYEKALGLDPLCAIAAQGLAIVTAEDALGTLGGALPPGPAPDEGQRRAANARDALEVFAKVRESTSDGSVYVNMGHCYFARDEFDRAIESYETASQRYYGGRNISVLLCLARSWYVKASKEQSFASMTVALQFTQKALHIQPVDKAVIYNIAMIQQKSAELLFSLPPAKRTLADLERGIARATHAQKMFGSLAADPANAVPYDRDLAEERKKYADSMLRRSEEHMSAQRQYEAEQAARLEGARQKRAAERERIEALEREREAKLRIEAEVLAVERARARQEAQQWSADLVKNESDEEREQRKARKAANRKVKSEAPSGDEGLSTPVGGGGGAGAGAGAGGAGAGNDSEPKKKRRKLKKSGAASAAASTQPSDAEDGGALFSEGEEEKPLKKVPVFSLWFLLVLLLMVCLLN
ncbi:RNA polymerase II-associated protein [Russula ochroleuca]|uniref:RNA polymerase II-associated protein n=1 Tax=Russula ochroleuca TaxID=152965 RepID=A0A9P5MRA9_9AGAM|nr:RNA polymerase II-associated protein [Russula ochroleuca]